MFFFFFLIRQRHITATIQQPLKRPLCHCYHIIHCGNGLKHQYHHTLPPPLPPIWWHSQHFIVSKISLQTRTPGLYSEVNGRKWNVRTIKRTQLICPMPQDIRERAYVKVPTMCQLLSRPHHNTTKKKW